MRLFRVIDTRTGKEANPEEIALQEEWAQSLVWCDMDGFYIGEDGSLILADECGNFVFCDTERFKIVWEIGGWFSVEERVKRLEKEIECLAEFIKNAGTLYFVI